MSATSFKCGHPIAPPFLRVNKMGKPFCLTCKNESSRLSKKRERERIASNSEMLRLAQMERRMRYLPGQIEAARAKVEALKSEARRYGMTELIEGGA